MSDLTSGPITPAQRERARAWLAAFDVIEAAATGASMKHAEHLAGEMAGLVLEDLSSAERAGALSALAVMAVFGIPDPVTDRKMPMRTGEVRQWLGRKRLEWLWVAS